MSKIAGELLWRRMRITLAGGNTTVDTGITQLSKSFAAQSQNEPPLAIVSTTPPAPGALPASRVQIIPEAPMASWTNITHGEPFFDPTTNTVKVQFANSGGSATINVLFWDPHTEIGPGQADPYNSGG